jgi:hypothetical protein
MDKKPNVFPSNINMNEAMKQANENGTKIAEQANKELGDNLKQQPETKPGELSAAEQMQKDSLDKLEAQLAAREALFARKRAEANGETSGDVQPIPEQATVSYAKQEDVKFEAKNSEISDEDRYNHLSQPQVNVPYDVLKLPSGGLLYKNHKSTVDVAYLNATDEDIITNPNLLQSGKFLEILINRKLINTPLRYRDLHVGDRNAIMIWLRATGYGPMYNIKLSDPNNSYKEFEVEVDLSKLPTKPLGAKPDENGLFDFKLSLTGDEIKFKLLSVGDIDDIEEHIDEVKDEFVDRSMFTLKKQIVSYNGVTEPVQLASLISRIRLGDIRLFRKYVEKVESGMDMNITVGTPGGESITTFLPLNLTFFWPDLGV